MRYLMPFIPAFAIGIGNAGLQISGYQNFSLAVLLWVVMIFLLGCAAAYAIRDVRLRRNKSFKVDPWYLTVAGLAGLIIFALVALTGVVWQRLSRAEAAPQIVINSPAPVAPAPSTLAAVKLIPNELPDVPNDLAQKVARYWQLKDAIPQLKSVIDLLAKNGTIMRDSMKPFDPIKGHPAQIGYVGRWQQSVASLKAINDHIYKNRPLDLLSAPEVALPTARAPDEAVFKEEDAEQLWKYRNFHFQLKNIQKQADRLLSEMENEAAAIRAASNQVPRDKFEQ